jgi:hypothetical protein
MYTEKGIVINQPESLTVNVNVKAELLLAKEELQRLLGVLPDIKDPTSRRETQLELAKALKVIRPVYATTRDGELEQLLKENQTYPKDHA